MKQVHCRYGQTPLLRNACELISVDRLDWIFLQGLCHFCFCGRGRGRRLMEEECENNIIIINVFICFGMVVFYVAR